MDKGMKALFLVFHGFQEYNGISKKIKYQIHALEQCGVEMHTCYYDVTPDGRRQWIVDGTVIADFGTGIAAKIRKRIDYRAIVRHCIANEIKLVYIRYYHNANPFTIHLLKSLRKAGIKVLLEIPTYPYDREYNRFSKRADFHIDRIFRRSLCRYVNAIVTFSNDEEIFGQRTIRISNGIDFDHIPLRKSQHDTSRELHLIGVAEIHAWHGFDRLINGLKDYYALCPEYKVYFHIVGNPSNEQVRRTIETPLHEHHLEQYVFLHGARHGAELDELFEAADFAVGSLARHRSGIHNIKTLKNREYAARGFGFVYSETDDDFEQMPYILKVPADESPVDIGRLVDFFRHQSLTPQEIRDSIRHLSWQEQMKIVISNS